MITALRKKFISIAASALFALILLVLLAVNGIFLYQNERSVAQSLDHLLNRGPGMGRPEEGAALFRGRPTSEEDKPPDGKDRFFGGFRMEIDGAVIFLDDADTIVKTEQTIPDLYSEEQLRDLTSDILEKGGMSGRYGYYRYRLVYINQEGAVKKLALINASRELYAELSMALISLAAGIVIFGIVLLVIILASGRAIRPMAESYEKQKRFITDAGHELKTPLTVINANNDLAKLTFGEHECFDTISRQAGRMNSLIRNLITLSRMDEEQKPDFTRFDLSEAVGDTLASFVRVAEKNGKKLEFSVPEGIFLNGDESKIRQLVAILADNAVKYCDEGGRIFARLHVSGKVHFEITNDYRDVKETDLSQLFERFYRADKARTSDGSYGLGLPIAKSIAGLHGGDITVTSPEEGKIRFDAAVRKMV